MKLKEVVVTLPTEEKYIAGEYTKPHHRARTLTARCEKEIFDAVKEAAFRSRVSLSAFIRVCMMQIAEEVNKQPAVNVSTYQPIAPNHVNDGGTKDEP